MNDLRAAVTWLRSRSEIDPGRIGLMGVCFGAGPALQAASFDPRVGAVACVASVFDHAPYLHSLIEPEQWRAWLDNLTATAEDELADGETRYVPVVAADASPPWSGREIGVNGMTALFWSPAAFDYFGSDRNSCDRWQNRGTVSSYFEILAFDPTPSLKVLSATPLAFVHGTDDLEFELSTLEALLEQTAGTPQLTPLQGFGHFDFYDDPACVEASAAAAAEFFAQALSVGG